MTQSLGQAGQMSLCCCCELFVKSCQRGFELGGQPQVGRVVGRQLVAQRELVLSLRSCGVQFNVLLCVVGQRKSESRFRGDLFLTLR